MLAISPPLSRSPSPIHRFPTITTTAPPSTSPQKHTPTLHISTRSIVFNTRINTPVYTTFTLHNPTPIAIHYTIQSTTQFYIADTNGVIIPQQTKTVEIAFLDHQEGVNNAHLLRKSKLKQIKEIDKRTCIYHTYNAIRWRYTIKSTKLRRITTRNHGHAKSIG